MKLSAFAVRVRRITGGDVLTLRFVDRGVTAVEISLADLRAAHEGFFPKLMGADAALA